MASVLEGIKVIDWSTGHVGPYAGTMLADLGADVIHIEEPQRGDQMRGFTQIFGQGMVVNGRSMLYELFNTNKRGMTLDLKKPEGMEIMHKLIKGADVFLTNFRPRAVARMGLDYQSVRKLNPRIIYCSSNLFGPKGPDRDMGGWEMPVYARSGVMASSTEEGKTPITPTVGMGDRIGAIFLAYGTLAALLARERLGIGQEVTSSQLGGMLSLESLSFIIALFLKQDPPHREQHRMLNPLYNWYLCKDGRWFASGMIQSERFWPAFCQAISGPELEKDPRFKDAMSRAENCEGLVHILDEVFATKTLKEWEKIWKQNDFQGSRLNKLSDLENDPQVVANEYVIDWNHPHWGPIKFPGFAFQLSETPLTLRCSAPESGQHNEEVLLELGYTWDQIGELHGKNVI